MFSEAPRGMLYIVISILYTELMGTLNVSHLGNAACMCVSIWHRWWENVEVGMGRIILFQVKRRLIINLLKSKTILISAGILKEGLKLESFATFTYMALIPHSDMFCFVNWLCYLEIFNYVFQFQEKAFAQIFLNVKAKYNCRRN